MELSHEPPAFPACSGARCRLGANAGVRRRAALAAAGAIDVEAILNDPATPVAGDPAGDVAIVAFMDYNCPFCKRSSPDLERFVDDDGKVRLVYKDWPILTDASVVGAHLALAAKYQGKYRDAHVAMMSIRGQKIDEASLRAASRPSESTWRCSTPI